MLEYNLEQINPILDIVSSEKMQSFQVSKKDKDNYGIIYSPFSLIKKMFDLFPEDIFTNPNNRWLDMGAGTGYFSIYLYHKLFISLKNIIANPKKRKEHIIKNMLYMVEIKESHIENLEYLFGKNANIIKYSFLSLNANTNENTDTNKFDIIIGNPPYNCNGQIKTPTNINIEKKSDGMTIWPDFIKKSIDLLADSGYLLTIVPAIWLKPDKAGIHKLLIGNANASSTPSSTPSTPSTPSTSSTSNSKINILKLHSLSTNETNKVFHYQAQTPTTYFIGRIRSSTQAQAHTINIYDNSLKKYIEYPIYRENISLPLSNISIIKKLIPYINEVGYIKVYKTNMPPSKSKFSLNQTEDFPYKNIKTCMFSSERKDKPEIIYEYSNIAQSYYTPIQNTEISNPKLVLAHKMYGFPFLDKTGQLGISYRDNYVIIDKSLQELETLKNFLCTKLALAIYDATRYRMRYLEKYAFELLPDITKIADFPQDINDNTIANFFNFSQEEREIIEKYPEYIYF